MGEYWMLLEISNWKISEIVKPVQIHSGIHIIGYKRGRHIGVIGRGSTPVRKAPSTIEIFR